MTSHRRQHYVPRSYLKAWSRDGKQVWALDTATKASKLIGIRSLAQSEYFNDAFRRVGAQVTDGLPADIVERQFQVWENELIAMRNVAEHVVADTRAGTLDERRSMATCIALQLLRTSKIRHLLLSSDPTAASRRGLLLEWLPKHISNLALQQPTFAQENISLLQFLLLWSTDAIPALAAELYHYIWIIGRNLTSEPFLTSDAPVAALSHDKGEPPYHPTPSDSLPLLKRLFCDDLSTFGLEIIFPVSPGVALLMFHPYDFAQDLGDRQGKVLVMGVQSIQIRNTAIAWYADRHVFGIDDDFQVVEAVLSMRA